MPKMEISTIQVPASNLSGKNVSEKDKVSVLFTFFIIFTTYKAIFLCIHLNTGTTVPN